MSVQGVNTRLPRHQRRAQVLDAAAHAFASGAGFAQTSMDDVANAAGVTRLIVYRAFPSKEDLYRAVLERVAARLSSEFDAIAGGEEGRGAAGALLRVAREDPDGFRLLWLHAAHEPAFQSYATDWRAQAVDYAAALLFAAISDPRRRTWAAHVVVDHAYDAVLAWLEFGEPDEDQACAELIAAGLRALVEAWADR